jgi:hypothetical protein
MAPKTFKKATKHQLKLRLALAGVSGGGKTYTALKIASFLVPGGRVAVIDTERESASLYADEFNFDTLALDSFHPTEYVDAIHAAEAEGYDVIIIDSLSHAWAGKDGVLDEKDKITKRDRNANSYTAWGEAGKLQDQLVEAITRSKCHVIVTMRSKMEHVQEKDERTNKTVVRKVGMKVIQRDDLEYEFTLFASMLNDNTMVVEKTRCKALTGAVIPKPGKDVADTLSAWLMDGAPEEKPVAPVSPAPFLMDLAASMSSKADCEDTWSKYVSARKEMSADECAKFESAWKRRKSELVEAAKARAAAASAPTNGATVPTPIPPLASPPAVADPNAEVRL